MKPKPARIPEEEDFGSRGMPKDTFEIQGPLCLDGITLSPRSVNSHLLRTRTHLILIYFAHLVNQ